MEIPPDEIWRISSEDVKGVGCWAKVHPSRQFSGLGRHNLLTVAPMMVVLNSFESL